MGNNKQIRSIEFPDGRIYGVREGLSILAKMWNLDETVIQGVKHFQLPNGEKYELDFTETKINTTELSDFLNEFGDRNIYEGGAPHGRG